MAFTSPADLAVAFRSFARRLSDALRDAEGDTAAAEPHIAALEAVVKAAAATLGVSAGADLATTGEAIARRIEAMPADEWDKATLESLRSSALAAGGELRRIESAVA